MVIELKNTPTILTVLAPREPLPGPEETLDIGLWAFMHCHPDAPFAEYQRAKRRLLAALQSAGQGKA